MRLEEALASIRIGAKVRLHDFEFIYIDEILMMRPYTDKIVDWVPAVINGFDLMSDEWVVG